MEVTWREVLVDVGWGRLTGKTCITGVEGTEASLRVVGVHGWLDNSNTFDTLVPLLPVGLEILVLDLPGHGYSDHLPPGAMYTPLLYAINLRRAVSNYGWKKFILLSHSMGSIVSVYFSAVFPEHVIALISLDSLTPSLREGTPLDWRTDALTLIKADGYEGGRTTVYKEHEAIERLVAAREGIGRMAAIDKDAANILLPRSARQVEGGYIWTHDPKARAKFYSFFSSHNWLIAVSSIKCPVLTIRATHGIYSPRVNLDYVINVYRENAAWFDMELVEGPHHVHLTHPHRVAPALSNFIRKVKNTLTPELQSKL